MPKSNLTGFLIRREISIHGETPDKEGVHAEGRPREDSARGWPSANQGERPREKPSLLAP